MNRMLRNVKGQMRVVEAMITCLIVISGLTASIYLSSMYAVTEGVELEKTGMNILSLLNKPEVFMEIVDRRDNWESNLKLLIDNLIPADTFYNLTIRSALDGQVIGTVSNLPKEGLGAVQEAVSIETTATISMPMKMRVQIPLDTVLVIDVSGSMRDEIPGDDSTKLEAAKEAAKMYIDCLNSTMDRVGVVSFSTTATLRCGLTYNFTEAKSRIDELSAGGWTNIGDGVYKANDEFEVNGREDALWVIILLSDGEANRPQNPEDPGDEEYPRSYALNASREASEMGIRMYTIGFGAEIDVDLLRAMVTNGGKYYYAPSSSDLMDIYHMIAQDLMFAVKCDIIVVELTIMRVR